jgi:hypothetical protein
MLCALFFLFICKKNAKERNPMQKKEEVGYQRLDGLCLVMKAKAKTKKAWAINKKNYLLPPSSSSSSNGVGSWVTKIAAMK